MSQLRPQFPHQHNEVNELKGLSGPFQGRPFGLCGLLPPSWSDSPGATVGKDSCQMEGRLSFGWSAGSECECETGKQLRCSPPGLRVLYQTQRKEHTSPDVYKPDCHPHASSRQLPWLHCQTTDAGSSFQPCPAKLTKPLEWTVKRPASWVPLPTPTPLKKRHDAVPTK